MQTLGLLSVESKFTKFFMPFFKAQASSSSKFASFFSFMTHNSSVPFWLKDNILLTKGGDQSANSMTSHCSH